MNRNIIVVKSMVEGRGGEGYRDKSCSIHNLLFYVSHLSHIIITFYIRRSRKIDHFNQKHKRSVYGWEGKVFHKKTFSEDNLGDDMSHASPGLSPGVRRVRPEV